MKLHLLTILPALSFATVYAFAAQKAVIVTYPDDTPYSVIDSAMEAVREAGGVVTHEYKLLKGFAAKASAKALEDVTALGNEYMPTIEEDSVVSINGDIVESGQ